MYVYMCTVYICNPITLHYSTDKKTTIYFNKDSAEGFRVIVLKVEVL